MGRTQPRFRYNLPPEDVCDTADEVQGYFDDIDEPFDAHDRQLATRAVAMEPPF